MTNKTGVPEARYIFHLNLRTGSTVEVDLAKEDFVDVEAALTYAYASAALKPDDVMSWKVIEGLDKPVTLPLEKPTREYEVKLYPTEYSGSMYTFRFLASSAREALNKALEDIVVTIAEVGPWIVRMVMPSSSGREEKFSTVIKHPRWKSTDSQNEVEVPHDEPPVKSTSTDDRPTNVIPFQAKPKTVEAPKAPEKGTTQGAVVAGKEAAAVGPTRQPVPVALLPGGHTERIVPRTRIYNIVHGKVDSGAPDSAAK